MTREILNETANYIYDVIRSSSSICWSWGFEHPKVTIYKDMAALVFKVNGFIYKGWVIVAYNGGSDLFEIFTFKNFQTDDIQTHISDVYIDTLVNTLDNIIETKNSHSDSYKKKVKQFYGIAN